MRILEIVQIVGDVRTKLQNLHVSDSTESSKTKVSNMKQARMAIEELKNIGLFTKEIRSFETSPLYETLSDSYQFPSSSAASIKLRRSELLNSISNFLDATSQFSEPDEDSIALKLPTTLSFDDLANIANELKRCISIPIADPQIGGEVRIKGVDNGSIWIYIALGTPAALTLVAGLAWAASVIYKKYLEGQAFRAYVNNLELKNEQTSLFVEAQKAQVDALIIEQAREVEKSSFANHDPERVERLKLSIGTMADLIKDGFEIHPSLLAPEEAKNLFPDFKAMQLPTFSLKQIADGDESEK